MTVAELIEKLQCLPADAPVLSAVYDHEYCETWISPLPPESVSTRQVRIDLVPYQKQDGSIIYDQSWEFGGDITAAVLGLT